MNALRLILLTAAAAALMACATTSEDAAWEAGAAPPPPSGPARDLPRAPVGVVSDDPLAAPPDVAGPPAEAEFTASGLGSRVLRPGTGTRHPRRSDRVIVHYTGWTTDGQRFDSSVERGEPATFGLGQVIAGWTEGVQLMVTGEKRRFWIPAALAYGESPRPGAPSGMLVFDVELLGIQ